MVDPRRRLLLYEIDLQCDFALKAYGAAALALERQDSEDFWYSIQALMTAAAQIREFLEGDSDLRKTLDIPGDSPLRQPELNSALDVHAALERWIASHPRGPLRLSNFGPLGVSEADSTVFARFIDTRISVSILFGIPFELPALLAAVACVSEGVKAELRHLREVV